MANAGVHASVEGCREGVGEIRGWKQWSGREEPRPMFGNLKVQPNGVALEQFRRIVLGG